MKKEKAAQIYRKICTELENHDNGAFSAFRAYQDRDGDLIITAATGKYHNRVWCTLMRSYVAQFLEMCFGEHTISPIDTFGLMFVGEKVTEEVPEDLDILEELCAALPKVCEEPPMFMYDGGEMILTQCEDAAIAVADFFGSMGFDAPTGFYNPIEDAQSSTVNLYTGLYYVHFM